MGKQVLPVSYSREETLMLDEALHDLPWRTTFALCMIFRKWEKLAQISTRYLALSGIKEFPAWDTFLKKKKERKKDELKTIWTRWFKIFYWNPKWITLWWTCLE